MKLVCWGMCALPLHLRSPAPAGRSARCAQAEPALARRRDRRRARGSRRRRRRPRLAASSRAAARRPARQQLLQLGDGPQRRDVDALGQRDAGVLERARQLGVHQAVEAQLAEPAAELHVGAAPARDGGDGVEQPGDLAALARRGQRALGLLVLAPQARDLGRHLAPLDRSLRGLGQIALPEVQAAHPLPDRQVGRHLAEVLLDLRGHLGRGQRRIVLEVEDHRARHLLADAVGNADDRQLLDERAARGRAPRPRRGRRSCRWRRRSRPSIGPTRYRLPSSSKRPRSPVWNQPSRIASAVASSSCQ